MLGAFFPCLIFKRKEISGQKNRRKGKGLTRVPLFMITSVCIISIIRIVKMYDITHSVDKSKEALSAAIWSSVELNTALICCTLPVLKPLYVKIIPNLGGARPKAALSNAPTTVGGGGKNRPVMINDESRIDSNNTHFRSESLDYPSATASMTVSSIQDEEKGINARIELKEIPSR